MEPEPELELQLTPTEARVLGALIEKQMTTPQYYPLTLNALVAACNQTSNRNPIVNYDELIVEEALGGLREKGMSRIVHSPGNRATKYRQVIDERYGLDGQQLAVLDVLLLRGPQTLGELRARTERMAEFRGTDEVERAIERLGRPEHPFVVRLERMPGQKEARYAHVLCGEVTAEMAAASASVPVPTGGGDRAERIAALEAELASLRGEVAELRDQFAELRALLE